MSTLARIENDKVFSSIAASFTREDEIESSRNFLFRQFLNFSTEIEAKREIDNLKMKKFTFLSCHRDSKRSEKFFFRTFTPLVFVVGVN